MRRSLTLFISITSLNIGAIACSNSPVSQMGRSVISGKLKHPSGDVNQQNDDKNAKTLDANGKKSADDDAEKDEIAPEKFFCETAGAYLQQAETTDYSQQLAVLCGPDGPTQDFLQAFTYAYTGDGEPKGKVLEVKTNAMYYTRLRYMFSLKTPFDEPGEIFGIKPHDAFAQGILTPDSALYTTVNSRVEWPKDSSAVQRIVQTYDLQLAKGAGIYDVRQTESNIYMLSDTRKDVALITEHLLNPEANPYWHDQKVLLVSISPAPNTTFIVGALEFTVKNRFDVVRFKQTMDELNIATFKKPLHVSKVTLTSSTTQSAPRFSKAHLLKQHLNEGITRIEYF